jgi:hypothetical protein
MRHPNRFFIFAASGLVAGALAASYANGVPPATEVKPQIVLTENEKEAVKAFNMRTSEYASLHKKLNASLPKLPDKATPEQIDKHQQSMVALIRKERKNAKPGDFFTPAMVALVRRASGATVAGSDGMKNKETIMDENPGTLPDVTVNDKYPEGVPMTSMPPELLETLPKLPEDQEYRFLGRRLILVDSCCQLVMDVTPNVLT